MGLHRLVTPGYFGGLPAGYDLINTPTAPGKSPAQADGIKIGGPNEGTYFLAFGEDARSINFNRGLKALAQNTDALDDLFHRDLVVMTKTADVTVSGSPIMTITLPAGTYLGSAGMTATTRNINLLFSLRDSNDRPIIDTLGANIINILSVNLTGGDAIGGGFSQNQVGLVTIGIQVGVTYRVYYGVRKNAGNLDTSTLLNERAHALYYGHETTGNRAHNASAIAYLGGNPWADGTTNPLTNVEAQLDKVINDLGGTAGAARIGAAAVAASPADLAAGSVRSQLNELLGYVNILNDYLNGTTIEAELNEPILTGAATAEDLSVSGTFEAAVANFSGAVHLLSTLIVDDDVTLNNTTHIAGTLALAAAAFTANNSTIGLTNTPLTLSGSSRINKRHIPLVDSPSQAISVLVGDVFSIFDITSDVVLNIDAASEYVNASLTVSALMGNTGAFSVTVKNSAGGAVVVLKDPGASGSHYTSAVLAWGLNPVSGHNAWLIVGGSYQN